MKPEEIHNQRIIISVLNWGNGHVARSISLIHQLIEQENTLFIACSESQKQIFRNYFPTLNFINHQDYPFSFKGKGNFGIDLLLAFSKLLRRLKSERKELQQYINEHQINICISDHRYGFFNKNCISIFITHQLQIALPKGLNWLNSFHFLLIKKFNFIWVPDNHESQFSGKLSKSTRLKNIDYIGIQSRFSLYTKPATEFEHVVIVSGPEPYAEQFYHSEIKKASKSTTHTIIITPKKYDFELPENANIQLSDNWKKCDEIILKAKKITSRTGYSTIMDLEYLKCESELIPTPGQYEQEYLFFRHKIFRHKTVALIDIRDLD